jgi:hypothetical protein
LKISNTKKKGCWSGSSGRVPVCKREALSSNPSTANKKRKKERKRKKKEHASLGTILS